MIHGVTNRKTGVSFGIVENQGALVL
jgi:hypothetical protein